MLYISGTLRQSGRVAFLGDRAALVTLLFVLASILIGACLRSPMLRRGLWAWAFTLALIVFDLFSINTSAYNATPQARFPVTPIIQKIREDGSVFRVVDEGKMPGHFGVAYDFAEIGGNSPLRTSQYDTLLELSEEKLWPRLNVRYVITGRPGFANADLLTSDGETHLLRLNNTLPRAWFVPYAIRDADDAQALDALAAGTFDPWSVAYLADSSPIQLPTPPARAEPAKKTDTAVFQSITPEHSRVKVNAPADGLLVLSENYYYPGWRASVDGALTPILRTDISLSGVPVRAGTHQIEFVFDRWSVKVGMVISALSAALGVLGIILVPKSWGAQVRHS
jgi:hypothetical protein